MYPHHKFIVKDISMIQEFIKLFPLATLILVEKDEIHTSYIPLIWKDSKLLGHIDVHNPMSKLLQKQKAVKVIFHGPENYISPGHFTSPEFPTYNYMKVEVNTEAVEINKDELRTSIIEMTELLDHQFPDNLKGKEERMEKTMDYIYGFQLKVIDYTGRFKMSQDKPKAHFLKAIEVLQKEEVKRHEEILGYFTNFQTKKNH